MFFNKVVSSGLLALFSLVLYCGEEDPITPPPVSDVQSFGVFIVKLVPEVTDNIAYTTLEGAVNDGPPVPDVIFEQVMEMGECKLFKAVSPFCTQKCGSAGKCISKDSCQPYPTSLSVGKVTVSGLKNQGAKTTFTMDPSNSQFYQMVGVPLDYPPFAEGDSVTLTAAGSASAAPFTLTVRGIRPLKVLNTEVVLEEGKPITLLWEKPAVADVSTISIRINISYHGGTKGEIQCEGADDGELTIPAVMLDKLKSYGFAGYPVADITRKSVATNDSAKVKVVVETTFTQGLTIPGVKSCTDSSECPSRRCVERMCQ